MSVCVCLLWNRLVVVQDSSRSHCTSKRSRGLTVWRNLGMTQTRTTDRWTPDNLPVFTLVSDWLSVNHGRDYTLTVVYMWNMHISHVYSRHNWQHEVTTDEWHTDCCVGVSWKCGHVGTLEAQFLLILEDRFLSCGYIRSSIFAYTSDPRGLGTDEGGENFVEMYTCSNTSLGRKRKNRWFCFFIFKTPPLFFYYIVFSSKHVRLIIRIERCSPVRWRCLRIYVFSWYRRVKHPTSSSYPA